MRYDICWATKRAWLCIGQWVLNIETSFFKSHCHLRLKAGQLSDSTICVSFGIPWLIAMWFSIDAPDKSWLSNRSPEESHECEIAFHHGSIWLKPWGPINSWTASDPWWRRGVSLDLVDLCLGKIKYQRNTIKEQHISVPLDGREYHGNAKWEIETWKRPLWFKKTRKGIWISMDQGEGLPHAGKGENSWDCGDDALCGWGAETMRLDEALANGVGKVLDYRDRYGQATQYA